MKVLIINGHAESGKSTFVQFCKETQKADIYEFSMVDAAKSMARLIGWDESMKSNKDRNFLSNLKDLIDRYNDGSYEYIKFQMENFIYSHDLRKETIVFIHAREPQDILRLTDEFNAKSVVVRRKFVEDKVIENHADSEWWMPNYDYTIINNSDLDYLKKTSEQFMDYILQEDWDSKSGENK